MNQLQQRGQAVFETAITLPLFLLVLFMLFCAIKSAIISERIERDVRYTQQILNSSNIYTEYSIPSLYDAASGAPSFMIVCEAPPPRLVSSSGPIYNNGITFSGLYLWNAYAVNTACNTSHETLLANDGFQHDLLFGFQTASISANFSMYLGAHSTGIAPVALQAKSMSYFHAASVADIEMCYPILFKSLSLSLARGDTINSDELSVTSQSIQAVPPVENLVLSQTCVHQEPKNVSTKPASQVVPSSLGPSSIPSPAAATTYG